MSSILAGYSLLDVRYLNQGIPLSFLHHVISASATILLYPRRGCIVGSQQDEEQPYVCCTPLHPLLLCNVVQTSQRINLRFMDLLALERGRSEAEQTPINRI